MWRLAGGGGRWIAAPAYLDLAPCCCTQDPDPGCNLQLILGQAATAAMHSGATPLLLSMAKIFVAKKYLVTPSVFKLQKWFLHQNVV